MKWKAPSDKAQLIMMAPVLVPILVVGSPIFAVMFAFLTLREKFCRSRAWHPWFAWRPVKLWFDDRPWAWLERVERQGCCCDYIYRSVEA